jgi:hypothetical protein
MGKTENSLDGRPTGREVRGPNLAARICTAEERCGRYLAEANQALERGDAAKADLLFEKSGFWRDRMNKLSGDL